METSTPCLNQEMSGACGSGEVHADVFILFFNWDLLATDEDFHLFSPVALTYKPCLNLKYLFNHVSLRILLPAVSVLWQLWHGFCG